MVNQHMTTAQSRNPGYNKPSASGCVWSFDANEIRNASCRSDM